MMAADLRSPHQRRSDHLSILTRRQPPPQSPGRFAKTFTDTAACAVGTFDPTFDSDADTEGPASGSSVWRRDFSRVMSTSSAASVPVSSLDNPEFAAAMAVATVAASDVQLDAVVAAQDLASAPASVCNTSLLATTTPILMHKNTVNEGSFIQIPEEAQPRVDILQTPRPDSFRSNRTKVDADSEDDVSTGAFARERGRSFYGREGDIVPLDDEMSTPEHLGPMSPAELRTVLDDDYELFYSPPKRSGVSNRSKSRHPTASVSPSSEKSSPTEASIASPSHTDSTSPSSPVVQMEEVSPSRALSAPIREPDRPDLMTHKSADTAFTATIASSHDSTDSTRRVRSYKVFNNNEDLTVSIVSDNSDLTPSTDDDGCRLSSAELHVLLQGSVERPRLSSGAVPLFVEEIGRVPRAAIVDGKMQRVRVSKRAGSSLHIPREKAFNLCGLRSLSQCWTGASDPEKKKSQKRKKSRRRRKKRTGTRSHTTGRRSSAARPSEV